LTKIELNQFVIVLEKRSLVQIKSHAQKVLKRINSGEHVFRRLEENISRLQGLVRHIHQQLNIEPPKILLQPIPVLSYAGCIVHHTDSTQVKRAAPETTTNEHDGEDPSQQKRHRNTKSSKDGTEHLAASALCQLAGPDDEENAEGTADVNGMGGAVLEANEGTKTEHGIDLGEFIGV
jgi:hypothetical protein